MKPLTPALAAQQARMVAALQEMVRVPTVNPPGSRYREMVEVLQAQCRALGMATCLHQVPPESVAQVTGSADHARYNLLASWDVGAPSTIHFNAHYDVVPAAGADWRTGDPFEPRAIAGALYGRGAGDMKGSIAALLGAVALLQEEGCTPAVNVECSFTADEETGGELGAGYVVRAGLVHADCVVVCEGAGGTHVGCGHNGVLWLEVQVSGRAAHASRPHEGVNAFEKMAALVHHLQPYARSLAYTHRRFRDFDGQERFPTATLGGVFGGSGADKVNTVPGAARFSIDRRLVPGEAVAPVEEEARHAIAQAARRAAAQVGVRTLLRIDPCLVEPRDPLPRSLARAVRTVRRRPAGFRVTSGFTDLHYFVREAGLPGVGYGVKGQHLHGPDERVQVHDLLQTARVYAELIRRGVEG
ncbi:MAG: ArgE/DapE family deacylase [Candidatus Latescibacterota bacterium]